MPIDNIGSQKLNVTNLRAIVDRNINSNESESTFIPTGNIRLPAIVHPKSELLLRGEFVSKENGIHYIALALSYYFNKANEKLTEYHEGCKIDVIPTQFESSNLIQGNINSLIAVVGAIVGGGVGSYFTYRYGKRIEEEKAERENKKEMDFNTGIKDLVYHELDMYHVFISGILERFPEDDSRFILIDEPVLSDTLLIVKLL
jgi:hypothetical protein